MNKQKQFEALARLDGLVGIHYDGDGVMWGQDSLIKGADNLPHMVIVPDYDSHNALQRVIDGFDVGDAWHESGKELDLYDHYLALAVNHPTGLRIAQHIATQAQKREAILRVKGMWEVSK